MPHPLPFFGAGAARYYEFAGIEVRFTKKPSTPVQKKIVAIAPRPLRVDAKSFKGKMLAIRSPQYVNEATSVSMAGRRTSTSSSRRRSARSSTSLPTRPAPSMLPSRNGS